MQFTSLFTRDEAVSPVTGVVPMVVITVVLAAIIGMSVLGLGKGVASTAPSASFEFAYDSGGSGTCNGLGSGNAVDISHTSGDEIPADQLTISDGSSSKNWYDCDRGAASTHDISAGNTASVEMDSDDTVRILRENDDSATSSIWDGPDA